MWLTFQLQTITQLSNIESCKLQGMQHLVKYIIIIKILKVWQDPDIDYLQYFYDT